jgi:predicted nucleic acid-binding protein
MQSERIESFLDSNVLIYAAAGKRTEPRKHAIAYDLVLNSHFGLSGQSLSEFCNISRRKNLLPDPELDEWLAFLGYLPLIPVDQNLVSAGLHLARRYRIGYYDAALLAAAEQIGAPVFYSEDLNHDQVYGSVRVVNPFIEN